MEIPLAVTMTPAKIRAARALALAADLLQIVVFPTFAEGFLSPLNDALDGAVAVAMISLLGWHWTFLPSFLAELVPMVDIVPTWTAAVWFVTRSRSVPPGEPDRPPEQLPPPRP